MEQRSNFLALCLLDALEDEEDKVIFKILEYYNVDPSFVQQERGISPLHYACGMPNYKLAKEIMERFLQCSKNINVRTQDNMTPLHVAAIHGRADFVRMLLQCGADWSIVDDERKTAVSYAIEECHFEVVKILRDYIFEYKYENKQISEGLKRCKESEMARFQQEKRLESTSSQYEQAGNASKFTPNKLHYNYDVTSPYYINITHRRNKPQPKFPDLDTEVGNKQEGSSDSTTGTSLLERVERKPLDTSEHVNIFTLTEENLQELSKNDPLSVSSRTSFIASWRAKVQSSTETALVLRQYHQVNEIIDSMIDSEKCNYINTKLNNAAAGSSDISHKSDCDSSSTDTHITQKMSQLTVKNNLKNHTCYHGLNQTPEEIRMADDAFESIVDSDGSYQTVPEFKVNARNELKSANDADDDNFIHSPKVGEYFLQMTEAYVHTDTEKGLVFYEKKFVRNQGNKMAEQRSPSHRSSSDGDDRAPSTNFTLPIDYDTDVLRAELTNFGEPPGPITKSTKRLYIKRLIRYKRKTPEMLNLLTEKLNNSHEKKFSVELYRTVRSSETFAEIPNFMKFEAESSKFFANNNEKKDLREGHLKQSFIYLLIDPRISCNLPSESDFVDKYLVWRRFLRSIFYVGKAKTSRPYSHLYDAMKLHSHLQSNQLSKKNANIDNLNMVKVNKRKNLDSESEKLNRILDIWNTGCGVVCLHVFHNIIPTDAYTREAAIIEALSLKHLTNLKRGNFYGPAKNWTMKEKKYLGIALLYKAMQIFLAEGESQLSPCDLI